MKRLLLLLLGVSLSGASFAQFSEFQNNAGSTFTLSSNNSTLQIGGRVSGYYEYRALKAGYTNLDHNGWAMKDGDIDLLGKTANKFVYEFHLSVLDLATAAATQNTNN